MNHGKEYLSAIRPDPGPARCATQEEVNDAVRIALSPLLQRQKERIDFLAEFDPWPTDPYSDEPYERKNQV